MAAQQPAPFTHDAALHYLQEELNGHIASFSSSKRFFRRMSLVQAVSIASLGAATTFLIGLAQIYPHAWISALSLAAASLATIAAAWTGWYGARDAWITNQSTLNRLYGLRSRIGFEAALSGLNPSSEKVIAYYTECQQILKDANADWKQNRASQNEPVKSPM
jgi:hypothetical protein